MPVTLRRLRLPAALLMAALALSACNRGGDAPAAAAGGAPPPPAVGVVTVNPQATPVTAELPGRVDSTRIAEVRARVPGVVLQRVFREGSDVRAGQLLFKIDPQPLQAELDSVLAAQQRAEAALYQARVVAERYEPLVKANAISKQEYDNAVAAQKLAQADVAAAQAAAQRARLNLGYATVNAPISGRIGRALVTEGALVGQGEATPMALIQQLNPIYVDFTQPVSELARLRAAFDAGSVKQLSGRQARITLRLDDGSEYPLTGRLLFSDVSVDRSTGQVSLRAEFPNPRQLLLPGMYVRVRLEQGINETALRVPQQAVQRAADGSASVYVVGANGQLETRTIKTGSAFGDEWIVTEGLKAGDTVVVEGFQKIRPGAPVQPVPWQRGGAPGQPAPGGQPTGGQATGGQATGGQPAGAPGGAPAAPGTAPAEPASKPAEPAGAAAPPAEPARPAADASTGGGAKR
ncbi:MAG: efflux RND transporter periplasmic adaptor subunit [Burkholderiaceae bacterium]